MALHPSIYWFKHLALDALAARHGDRRARHALATRLREHPWSPAGRPFGAPEAGDPASPHVAFLLTPCCWYPFTSPLVQLALALHARSLPIRFVAGHGGACGFFGSNPGWSAARCGETFTWLDREILPAWARLELLNDHLDDSAGVAAEAFVQAHLATPLGQLQADGGPPLWDALRCTFARQLAQQAPGDYPLLPAASQPLGACPAVQPWVRSALLNLHALGRWLDEWRGSLPATAAATLVLFNGFSYQERLAAWAARARGIRVVAHENSSFANRRIFDATGEIGNATSVAGATWPRVRGRRLSPAQQARLDRHFAAVFAGANNTIAQPAVTSAALREQLGLAAGERCLLLLAQVPHDTVMVRDLPHYADGLAFLRAAIAASAGLPRCTLVIRLHPAEGEGGATARALRAAGVPAHVRLVEGQAINTQALMRLADAALTATSQAGLEFLWLGKPLVVAGNAFYAGKGFTLDLAAPADLPRLLDEALDQGPLAPAQLQLCRSLLYHVVFEHQVPYDAAYLRFPPRSVDRIVALLRGQEFIDWAE